MAYPRDDGLHPPRNENRPAIYESTVLSATSQPAHGLDGWETLSDWIAEQSGGMAAGELQKDTPVKSGCRFATYVASLAALLTIVGFIGWKHATQATLPSEPGMAISAVSDDNVDPPPVDLQEASKLESDTSDPPSSPPPGAFLQETFADWMI